MSTKFGVYTGEYQIEQDEYGNIMNDIPSSEFTEVAFRSNGVRWINDLARILPNETKVYPLDNSAQGIYTIGDIRKAIDES